MIKNDNSDYMHIVYTYILYLQYSTSLDALLQGLATSSTLYTFVMAECYLAEGFPTFIHHKVCTSTSIQFCKSFPRGM